MAGIDNDSEHSNGSVHLSSPNYSTSSENGTSKSRLSKAPTVGELERALGQNIGTFYRQLTGQQPKRIVCHLFSSAAGVIIEQSLTSVEDILLNASQVELANQVRLSINSIVRNEIKALVEEILQVPVKAALIDSALGTGYTGILLILEEMPRVRTPGAIPKTEANRKLRKRQLNGSSAPLPE